MEGRWRRSGLGCESWGFGWGCGECWYVEWALEAGRYKWRGLSGEKISSQNRWELMRNKIHRERNGAFVATSPLQAPDCLARNNKVTSKGQILAAPPVSPVSPQDQSPAQPPLSSDKITDKAVLVAVRSRFEPSNCVTRLPPPGL